MGERVVVLVMVMVNMVWLLRQPTAIDAAGSGSHVNILGTMTISGTSHRNQFSG